MDDDVACATISHLRQLQKLSSISAYEADALEGKYRSLQAACFAAQDEEKILLRTLRQKQNEVLGERVRVESALEKSDAELELLRADNERVQNQLDELKQNEAVSKYEILGLERSHDELTSAADVMLKDNVAMVQPELRRLEKEVTLAREAFHKLNNMHMHDTQHKHALEERLQILGNEKQNTVSESQRARELLQKASVEPERIRKQTECVKKAVEKVQQEVLLISNKNNLRTKEIARKRSKRNEAGEVRDNLLRKLQLHYDTILHRQRDVDAVKRNVTIEKTRTHQLAEVKLRLEINRKEVDEVARHQADSLSSLEKEMDVLGRRYQKKQSKLDAANKMLPTLKSRLKGNEELLSAHLQENKDLSNQIDAIKQKVDVGIACLLRQEGLEKTKRSELETLLKEVAAMEDEISSWRTEECRQNKLIAILGAQREIKAREATRARTSERDAREQVKVKELVILDLSKKVSQVRNRLKEFSALYDVAKNEKNKYINLVLSSSQALAEMKEKTKILMNEVEILRNESVAKDKALAKESVQHLASQAQRDSLRLDVCKTQSQYCNKQDFVDHQIIEVDKLNILINKIEKDLLQLKGSYAKAAVSRNTVGVALIDRNDELCILYEKVNLQEQTIKCGELGIRQKDRDIRMLKLQLSELQRQVVNSRKQLPHVPTLVDAILELRSALEKERCATESLCRCMESPSNHVRWHSLQGDDPDREHLLAKIGVLEQRLSSKKETLLENELVLKEVTTLTSKLRNQLNKGRDEALCSAVNLNELQAKVRDATKRMMAIISELSMYQATAMKLQQQKHSAKIALEESKWRVMRNEPPTEDAINKLRRQGRRHCDVQDSSTNQVRTTAEPRPNAYIPDVAHGLGVPKPYSSLAPFRPSAVGASMRHYRLPSSPAVISL